MLHDEERAQAVLCVVCGAQSGKDCMSRGWRPYGAGFARMKRTAHRRRINDGRRYAASLDCTTCGACCFSTPWNKYNVDAVDDDPFVNADERTPAVYTEPGLVGGSHGPRAHTGRRLQVVGGRCLALQQDGDRYACRLHGRHPIECRSFPRGGFRCRVIRLRHRGTW